MKVKSLRDYIEKIANDKKNNLKHLNDADNIDVCFDLDAGGGRVVAEFVKKTDKRSFSKNKLHLNQKSRISK